MKMRDRIAYLEEKNERLAARLKRKEAEPKPLPLAETTRHEEVMARLDAMSSAVIQIRARVNDTDDAVVSVMRKVRKDNQGVDGIARLEQKVDAILSLGIWARRAEMPRTERETSVWEILHEGRA
jgi:hypothetical protein